MRTATLLALTLGLGSALGCGKKPAPPPDEGASGEPGKAAPAPADDAAAWRGKQVAALKSNNPDARRAAVDELAWLVGEDPAAGPILVELMKDKGARGRTLTDRVNSTREAAALALYKAGPKGEALLKEKGLPILRDGLSDPARRCANTPRTPSANSARSPSRSPPTCRSSAPTRTRTSGWWPLRR